MRPNEISHYLFIKVISLKDKQHAKQVGSSFMYPFT